MLTAQTSRANSQISTPRLTPLRLIERNRNTDKNDINRLEDKIKELENSICEAKEVAANSKMDKLEASLASIPAMNEPILLDGISD